MTFKHAIFPIALLSMSSAAFAATYTSDFSALTEGAPLDGVDGWVQSEPNNDPLSPLSWVGSLNGQNSGAIGTYYEAPAGVAFSLTRPLSMDFGASTVVLDFGINDSTTDFASRNNFSFTIGGAAGVNLFTAIFTPQSQTGDYDAVGDPSDAELNNSLWDLSWSSIGGSGTSSVAVQEDGLYSLSLLFNQNGADVDFSMTLDSGLPGGSFTENGTLAGLGSENSETIGFGSQLGAGVTEWGDNFMAFQVAAVPEPGSMMLLSLAGLGFLRRRR